MSLKAFRKQGKRVWKKGWKLNSKEKDFGDDKFSLGRARMKAREYNRTYKKLARKAERREGKKLEEL